MTLVITHRTKEGEIEIDDPRFCEYVDWGGIMAVVGGVAFDYDNQYIYVQLRGHND